MTIPARNRMYAGFKELKMTMLWLAYLYTTVAFLVSGYIYFAGVVSRPRPIQFELHHKALLGAATLAIGIVWPVFMPAVTAIYLARGFRSLRAAASGVRLTVRGAVARG